MMADACIEQVKMVHLYLTYSQALKREQTLEVFNIQHCLFTNLGVQHSTLFVYKSNTDFQCLV